VGAKDRALRISVGGNESRGPGVSNYQIGWSATINGGIMDPGTLNAISEGMRLNLMLITQTVALIIGLAATAGFVIYLIGIARLYISERRQQARRRSDWMCSAPEPPDPDEYDLLVTLAYLDDSVGGYLSSNRHTSTNHYMSTKENNEQTY
jgi:hypothetical protein